MLYSKYCNFPCSALAQLRSQDNVKDQLPMIHNNQILAQYYQDKMLNTPKYIGEYSKLDCLISETAIQKLQQDGAQNLHLMHYNLATLLYSEQ